MLKKAKLSILATALLCTSGIAEEMDLGKASNHQNKANITSKKVLIQDTIHQSRGRDEKSMTAFLNSTFESSPVSFNHFQVLEIHEIPKTPWREYLLVLNITSNLPTVKDTEVGENRAVPMEITKILFTDGFFVTGNLYDPYEEKFLSDIFKPVPGDKSTTPDRLIFGDASAEHKVVIYSDPLCPFCREEIPSLLKKLKESKKNIFSVYLINFPLERIHPAATTLSKIINLELEKGNKDIVEKMYTVKIDPGVREELRILDIINSELGTKYTPEEINTPSVVSKIERDKRDALVHMITGTPSSFIDGKKTRDLSGDIDTILMDIED